MFWIFFRVSISPWEGSGSGTKQSSMGRRNIGETCVRLLTLRKIWRGPSLLVYKIAHGTIPVNFCFDDGNLPFCFCCVSGWRCKHCVCAQSVHARQIMFINNSDWHWTVGQFICVEVKPGDRVTRRRRHASALREKPKSFTSRAGETLLIVDCNTVCDTSIYLNWSEEHNCHLKRTD